MVKPILSFKALRTFILSVCMLPVPVFSNGLGENDHALFENSRAKSKSMAGDIDIGEFNNKHISYANSEAKTLFEQLKAKGQMKISTADRINNIAQEPKDPTENSTQLVFISLSLGEASIKQILDESADNKRTTLVLRGVPEGMKLMEGIAKIHALINTRKSVPSVIINPTLFKDYKIDRVPTVVLLDLVDTNKYKLKSKAVGIYKPEWLINKYAENNKLDQGTVGPSREISEPDLIEVAKQRILDIDWNEKKRLAIKNVWKNQKFLNVERSSKYEVKVIDPTVVVTKDIKTPDGKVIVREGSRINPLDIRKFSQELIIFDATDKKQVDIAMAASAAIRKQNLNKRITFITTKINAEDGWKSFKKITDTLNSHVFVLSPDVAQRFEITAVPAIVKSEGNKFVVKTYSVEEGYK